MHPFPDVLTSHTWEVFHCLLSAKSVASNGLWKGQQNQWICKEGKQTVFNLLFVKPSVGARFVCGPEVKKVGKEPIMSLRLKTVLLYLDFIGEFRLQKDFE